MEDSKKCANDGLLSKAMIGTRREAKMLNNSSRFPSRRPSCRSFALFSRSEGGEVARAFGIRASHRGERQSQSRKQADLATSLHSNIGESGHYRSGSPPKNFDAEFPLFPLFSSYQ